MAPPPLRAPVVRDRTYQRIRDGVEDQRDEERRSAQRPGNTEYLVVIEEDEEVEGTVLQALGELTDAEGELAAEGDLPVAHGRLAL